MPWNQEDTERLWNVPLEAALTATLLLRGLTFWLPMVPGLWLTRRELRHAMVRASRETA